MKVLMISFLETFGLFLTAHGNLTAIPQTDATRNSEWKSVSLMGLSPRSAAGRREAPEFMVELYDAAVDSDRTLKNTKVLHRNVVRSFQGRSSGLDHFFNLTSLQRDERVIKAEFRWFGQTQILTDRHLYKIVLHTVLEDGMKSFLSARLLPVFSKGWEIFNITKMVTKWIQNNGKNAGMLVVTARPTGNRVESRLQMDKKPDEKISYLVIYSDDGRHYHDVPQFSGHNISISVNFLKPVESLMMSARRKRRSVSSLMPTCQRNDLYVDFSKIGWSGWIISPKGYNAHSCMGFCPFPLGEGLRATNHATVRSIMNTLKLASEAGKPCCVPDVLHPISLLYFDDEENVVLKQFDDMIAASCGCH